MASAKKAGNAEKAVRDLVAKAAKGKVANAVKDTVAKSRNKSVRAWDKSVKAKDKSVKARDKAARARDNKVAKASAANAQASASKALAKKIARLEEARSKEQKRLDKIEEAKAEQLIKMKEAYERSAVPLDPAIAKLATTKLLSVLIKAKKGWFGDPEKKLRKDIIKKLGVTEAEVFTRGTLLAYSRLTDVASKALKILKKEEAARAKKAKKRPKKKPVKWKFTVTNPAIANLLTDLKQTKRGFFGDPEKRLMKDVAKRLRITPAQASQGEILLSYAALPDVSKRLSEVRFSRAKSKGLLSPPKADYELLLAAPLPQMPQSAAVIRPLSSDLLGDLKQTKRGFFGDPEKRLIRDISQRLNVAESDALKDENIDAYAELKDIRAKLERIYEKKALSEAKEYGPEPAPLAASLPKKPELMISATLTPDISERAKRLQEVVAEQKKIDAQEASLKVKRRRAAKAFAKPFKLVASAINYILSRILRAIFTIFTVILSIPITLGRLIIRGVSGLLEGIYRRAGRFSPFGWKKKVNQLIIFSGINKTQEEVTGITIVNGTLLAALVGASAFFFLGLNLIFVAIAALASFGFVWLIVYAILNLMADKRTDEVESTLPDVLQIVSANISAGMTPYNALWVSARKEFGALAEEIKIAQKETLGGKSFAEALSDMGQRVRSNVLQRTVRLLVQGMKAGGELPNILQGIGNDIRQMRLLQKEMSASTMSYTMFILFGMILGAPLLFSVSIQFVDIINKFQPEGISPEAMAAAQSSPAMGGMQGFNVMSLGNKGCPKDFDGDGLPDTWEKQMGLNSKNKTDALSINPANGETYLKTYQDTAPPVPGSCITSSYLSVFATLALLSIAFFGSLLIGLIREGKQSAGLKMAPILIPVTLGMFWLMSTGMRIFFGSMFGGS